MVFKFDTVSEAMLAYENAKQYVFEHCGYVEQWRDFPLNDERTSFWSVNQRGYVRHADSEKELKEQTGNYYEAEVVNNSNNKGVYRGKRYTLVIINTNTDGNVFATVFDNLLERPWVKE